MQWCWDGLVLRYSDFYFSNKYFSNSTSEAMYYLCKLFSQYSFLQQNHVHNLWT